MDAKRQPIENDEPRHRKKSKKKWKPRADHKHEYKTVLLYSYMDNPFKQGEKSEYKHATKVCAKCGRVDTSSWRSIFEEVVGKRNTDVENLEKWYLEDYFDKFAKKMEER